jgi:hypothetical protein
MSRELRIALDEAVAGLLNVSFAYVPLVYVQNEIDPPKQMLYLVLQDSARECVEEVMSTLESLMHARWPQGEFIDMLPVFCDHPWLNDVIRTGCFLAANDEDLHRRCVERAHRSGPTGPGEAQDKHA